MGETMMYCDATEPPQHPKGFRRSSRKPDSSTGTFGKNNQCLLRGLGEKKMFVYLFSKNFNRFFVNICEMKMGGKSIPNIEIPICKYGDR